MAKKNSDRNYRSNKIEICAAYNRMISMVSSKTRVLFKKEFRYRVGIDKTFTPVTIGFTGKIKQISWSELAKHFKDGGPDKTFDINTTYSERQRILRGEITETRLKSEVASNLRPEDAMRFVDIMEGDGIYEAFANCRPGSCMSHSRDLIQLYANNPDLVDCIVFHGCGLMDNKPSSWLRWKHENTNEFDRAYFVANSKTHAIIKDCLREPLGVKSDVNPPSSVTLAWVDCHLLPYTDTYTGCSDYCKSSETVTLSKHDDENGNLDDTSGFDPENYGYHCDDCGCRYNQNQGGGYSDSYDMSLCEDCCGYCEYLEESVPTSEIDRVDVYWNGTEQTLWISERALSSEFTESDLSGTWCHDSEYITLSNGSVCAPSDDDYVTDESGECHHIDDVVLLESGEYIQTDEAIEIDGRFYESEDSQITETDDGWRLVDDCIEIVNEYYCKDSDEIVEIDGEYYLKSDDNVEESEDGTWHLVSELIEA